MLRLGFRTEDPNKQIKDKPHVEPLRLGYTTVSPFTPEDRLKWDRIFKRVKQPVSLVDVGGEKVTVAVPWERGKLYMLPQLLGALSKLTLNGDAEIYFTVDNNPAPERWSREGRSKQGQRERRRRVAASHNRCRRRAMDNGSDYLWIVEADLLPPRDAYLRLRTLMVNHRADVAVLPYTWHYISERGPLNPRTPLMGWRGEPPRLRSLKLADFLLEPYPARLTTSGFGCILFKRRVFERKFELDSSYWCTDGVFAKRVVKENLRVLADNRVFTQHFCCRKCFRMGYGELREDWNFKEEVGRFLKNRNVTVNVVNEI